MRALEIDCFYLKYQNYKWKKTNSLKFKCIEKRYFSVLQKYKWQNSFRNRHALHKNRRIFIVNRLNRCFANTSFALNKNLNIKVSKYISKSLQESHSTEIILNMIFLANFLIELNFYLKIVKLRFLYNFNEDAKHWEHQCRFRFKHVI